MDYNFEPVGICPKSITFHLEGDVVTNIHFHGGCPGNLKMLAKIADGWTVDAIYKMMNGNLCGEKGTSCADQLAQAVKLAFEHEKKNQQ